MASIAPCSVAQQDRPPRRTGRAAQLRAHQTQLRAQVALGGHLAAEVDQGAKTAVLFAQASQAIGSH